MRTTRPALAAALFAAAALLAAAAIGPDASAQAPRPAPAAAQADAAYEAARLAFEALPEAERKAIQEALVWTGDHNGVTSGGFGRRTFEAIVAYQKRGGLKPDGTLDAKARAALQTAAKKLRDDAKFAVLADAKTGIAIGVPQAVLPKRDVNPNGGSRWQSPDGKITLDTRAFKDGETDLPALYERNLAIQSPGRQVAYKVLRPDFFVVSGETATGKFYTRYAGGPGGIRGFSLGYDKAAAKAFDRTVIAIANSFTPFPEAASAAATGPAPPARPANLEPPRPTGPIATGLSVGPRIVVTSASVEACPELRVAKGKARLVKADKAAGLALLEVEAARRATPLGVRTDALGADIGGGAVLRRHRRSRGRSGRDRMGRDARRATAAGRCRRAGLRSRRAPRRADRGDAGGAAPRRRHRAAGPLRARFRDRAHEVPRRRRCDARRRALGAGPHGGRDRRRGGRRRRAHRVRALILLHRKVVPAPVLPLR